MQFLNNLMSPCKKAQYRDTFNQTLNLLRVKHNCDPCQILSQSVAIAAPLLKVMSTKRGSKTIHTPYPVSEQKRNRVAIRWIINAADKRKGSLETRLADEINAVIDGTSSVLMSMYTTS